MKYGSRRSYQFFLPMEPPTVTQQEHRMKAVQKNIRRSDGKVVQKAVPVMYEDARLKDARQKLTAYLTAAMRQLTEREEKESGAKGGNRTPGIAIGKGIPVHLTVKWCFGIKNKTRASASGRNESNESDGKSRSASRSESRKRNGDWKVTKPDTDNLQKMLKDCMTEAGFWADDAQVCDEIIQKFWSDTPGIWISVMEMETNWFEQMAEQDNSDQEDWWDELDDEEDEPEDGSHIDFEGEEASARYEMRGGMEQWKS